MQIRIQVLFIVLAVSSMTGCSASNVPSTVDSAQDETQTSNETDTESQYPKLKWKWTESNGKEIESTGSAVSTSDASFRIVEDNFRKLDWKTPTSKPSLAIELAEDRSLAIMHASNSTPEEIAMMAVWSEPGPVYGKTTSVIIERSMPFSDAEKALSVLRAYLKDDGNFKSLVDWEPKTE